MKENVEMFAYTQMIIFMALATALYAVFLYIFTLLPVLWIIPGFTSVRPANSIPIVMSLLFGPAASWGTAFGNLIGYDIMGGALTIGSIGGFAGNFIMGLLPYYTWTKIFKEKPDCKTPSSLAKFELTAFLNSAACALVIAWWLEVVGILPLWLLGLIITLNNFVMEAIIGPVLMVLLWDRAERMGWIWTDIMEGYEYTPTEVKKMHLIGYILVFIGGGIGTIVSIAASFYIFGGAVAGLPMIALGGMFIAIMIVGLILMAT